MTEAGRLVLPDFCAARSVLAVLLIVALTALLLTLASGAELPGFWLELARTSLFLVWIGLSGAALLCATRARLARLPAQQAAALVLSLMAAIIALVSELAWRIGHSVLDDRGMTGLFPHDHLPFLLRNVAIGAIVTGLALRYFYVTQQWRLNVEIQARARVTALQARIRPHFLYNSLNTIAQLTRSDPAGAEEAIQDLSDLFRANLSEHRGEITLGDELEIARAYQRIEALRLGSRLSVDWQVDDLPLDAPIPSLLIQPLLENAIGHGIERLPEGGTVHIEGGSVDDLVRLTVRNPLPLDAGPMPARSGFGLALDNIRERLALRYGSRARVTAGRQGDEYVVELVFPVAPLPGLDAP
ncbi:sensor histidine kinase [bacterium]|nr:MAG: sensor histidine kinase [bacterium]